MRQVSCSTGKCMELVLLVISRARICLVQPKTYWSLYFMIYDRIELVSCTTGNCMELGLLVNSRTWIWMFNLKRVRQCT
jgi:hypothetical protein